MLVGKDFLSAGLCQYAPVPLRYPAEAGLAPHPSATKISGFTCRGGKGIGNGSPLLGSVGVEWAGRARLSPRAGSEAAPQTAENEAVHLRY